MAVTIRGSKILLGTLKRLGSPEMKRAIDAALYTAGDIVAKDAQISITTGSVSGKNHVPSLPGQAPNNDDGLLAGGIETRREGSLTVHVVSTAPYSAALEFGTSKMAERPFMRPAARRNKDKAVRLVAAAISRVAKDK